MRLGKALYCAAMRALCFRNRNVHREYCAQFAGGSAFPLMSARLKSGSLFGVKPDMVLSTILRVTLSYMKRRVR